MGHCLSPYRPKKVAVPIWGTADAGALLRAAAPVGGHVDGPEQECSSGRKSLKEEGQKGMTLHLLM